MSLPDCKIKMSCPINLSESPEKVQTAITNIFPDCVIKVENYSVTATSDSPEAFEQISKSIHSRQSQKTYKRIMEGHLDANSTWFYINKQAAFAKKIIICDSIEESPLDPIRVTITSEKIQEIIDWLVGAH